MSKELLIQGLNQDLAAEWSAIARYMLRTSQAIGVFGESLRQALLKEVQDRLAHITFLTDTVVELGGKPTTCAEAPQALDDPQAMLESDLALEMAQIERYQQHAKLAAELGQSELGKRLEAIARNEAGHADELRYLLDEPVFA